MIKVIINKDGEVSVIKLKNIPRRCRWMIKNFKKRL